MVNGSLLENLVQPQIFLPIAAILVAIFVPIYIAHRAHQIQRPRLMLDVGHSIFRGAKIDSSASRHFILAMSDLPAHAQEASMPYQVQNNSSRSVNDVNIEIDIPKSFYIENEALWTLLGDLYSREFVPQFVKESRFASDLGDYVRIHYKLGSIHPQTSISMSELLHLDEKNTRVHESIISNGFGHIVRSIHRMDGIAHFCFIRVSCYAENVSPMRKYIYFSIMQDNFVDKDWLDQENLVPGANAKLKEPNKIISRDPHSNLSRYISAFWFGFADASISFCPFVPFMQTGLAKAEKFEIISVPEGVEYKVSRKSEEEISVARMTKEPENILVLDVYMPKKLCINFPLWVTNYARLSMYHGCINCEVMREAWRSFTKAWHVKFARRQ
jgi:hypothetical protein